MSRRSRMDGLVWDDGNRDHIVKQAVLPEEAEEILPGEPVIRETYKQRLLVIGPTLTERVPTVIVGPVPGRPGAFDVFRARPASRNERREFAEQRGGLLE